MALDGVDLVLREGDRYALLGPNGAGKTTLIRILATLSRPTAGRMLIGGLDVRECTADVRRQIGVVSHQTLLYRDLTVEENLRLYARLYDLPDASTRVWEVLKRTGLERRATDPLRTLSRGLQQRASIARAILHNPAILLLDEPFSGLDQHAADALTGILEEMALREHTIFMATHDFGRGLHLCNRIGVLGAGRLIYEGEARGLSERELRTLYMGVLRARET